LRHGVVDALGAAVGFWVVGASVDLVDAEALVDGVGELGAEMLGVVGKERHGAPPKRDVAVNEDVGGALGGELGLGDGVHIGSPAEAVGEKQDVAVASGCQGKRSEVVVADQDAGAVGQGQGDDGPADGLPRSLARLAHEAPAKPEAYAGVHANPPEKALKHAKRSRGAEVVRGHGMAGVEGPMSHSHRHVDADGAVEAAGDGGGVSKGVDVRVSHKHGGVVVRDV